MKFTDTPQCQQTTPIKISCEFIEEKKADISLQNFLFVYDGLNNNLPSSLAGQLSLVNTVKNTRNRAENKQQAPAKAGWNLSNTSSKNSCKLFPNHGLSLVFKSYTPSCSFKPLTCPPEQLIQKQPAGKIFLICRPEFEGR